MKTDREYVLYLLHYDRPFKGRSHYLGITTRDRLQARLKEHAGRGGTPLTQRLANLNFEFYCVRVWQNSSYQEERRRKMSANLKRSCPLCRNGQTDIEMMRFPTLPRQLPPLSADGEHFAASLTSLPLQNPMKKGRAT